MLNIFIGYDKRETVSFHVLSHSIMERASGPVSITPLYLPQLRKSGIYTREKTANESTDFTFSRFLTPYLASSVTSIFMDCDMLCLGDIYELASYATKDLYKDVFVVKHDYTPKLENKFLNQKQTLYPCKNWSSVMVFNGHRSSVKDLHPYYVNNASPMELHQFKWTNKDSIGELPKEWNHLVGEYKPNPDAKLVHFTRGGPWFNEYSDCEYSEEWFKERDKILSI